MPRSASGILIVFTLIQPGLSSVRAGTVDLEGALDRVIGFLDSPAACPETICTRPAALPRTASIFERALRLIRREKDPAALSRLASGVRKFLRSRAVSAGELPGELSDLVGMAELRVVVERSALEARIVTLGECHRDALRRKVEKPDALLERALAERDSGDPVRALKSLGRALRRYGSLVAGMGKRESRPCPGPLPPLPLPLCPAADLTILPAPPESPCLLLDPIAAGTRLVYRLSTSALLGTETTGDVSINYESPTGFSIDGTLDAPLLGEEVELQGTMSFGACRDGSELARIQEFQQSLTFSSPTLGTVTSPLTVSIQPPTMSIGSSVIPLPPLARRLCVGERILEEEVELTSEVPADGASEPGPEETILVTSTSQHRVVAVETVTVPAGRFRAARIVTAAASETEFAGGVTRSVTRVTTWVTDRAGQVRAVIDVDGQIVAELELVSLILP